MLSISSDYQYIQNPAFSKEREPVHIISSDYMLKFKSQVGRFDKNFLKLVVKRLVFISFFIFLIFPPNTKAEIYNLTIDHKKVNLTGREVEKITVNGTIPGPVLRFYQGEDVVINVKNNLK